MMIFKSELSVISRGYIPNSIGCWSMLVHHQWIGLRENLQETIDFPIKYEAFL